MHRDRLGVEGLRLRCMLGTRQPGSMAMQDVVVTFSVCADLAKAARKDQLDGVLDLARVVRAVRTYVASAAHELIESLAAEIARVLLTEFRVESATVTVRKPGAFPDADAACVTLTRDQGYFATKHNSQ